MGANFFDPRIGEVQCSGGCPQPQSVRRDSRHYTAIARGDSRRYTGCVQLYPMKFVPILQPRVWGGRNLAKLGKKLPSCAAVGESWELCDRGAAQSVIANGPLAGKTLGWVWKNSGLIPNPKSPFPLLIKWLDVAEPLSVQVHPDEKTASRLGGRSEPKTEAWYIIAVARDAKIWAGLKSGVTRKDLERAIASGMAEKFLRSFKPRTGEIIFIPAGCAHAARGVVALEAQQNSDTTYRLYDWGHGRKLQIENGIACVNLRLQPKRARSVVCQFFSMRAVSFGKSWMPPCQFSIVCIVKGAGEICWDGGRERFVAGDCWFVPSGVRFEVRARTTVVIVRLPKM